MSVGRIVSFVIQSKTEASSSLAPSSCLLQKCHRNIPSIYMFVITEEFSEAIGCSRSRSPSMARQPRRRRRPALSCVECRRRKIKCDRISPCAHCVSNKADCIYRAYNDRPSPLREHHRSPTLSPSAPVHPVPRSVRRGQQSYRTSTLTASTPHSALSPPLVPRREVETQDSHRNDGRNQLESLADHRDSPVDFRHLLQRVRKLEASSASNSTHPPSDTSRDILSLQSGPVQDAQILLNKTRVLRWSFWTGMSQDVSE